MKQIKVHGYLQTTHELAAKIFVLKLLIKLAEELRSQGTNAG